MSATVASRTTPHAVAVTDQRVRELVEWHFAPATGSHFWLRSVPDLGFDPRRDVRSVADLARFPDRSAELTTVPIDDLVPKGLLGRPLEVFESGGALGPPKRIIDLGSRSAALPRVNDALHASAFPVDSGHWLHVGPSGPHLVGTSIGRLARLNGRACFYVDFDPRWVRSLVRRGDHSQATAYVDHVLDQVDLVTATQGVSVALMTPPVLEAAAGRPALVDRLRTHLRGLLWSGTSMSRATLYAVETDLLPGTTVVGIYGNTLMGMAPQRPRRVGDPSPCVFQPDPAIARVSVVDPTTGSGTVAYGERGRVRLDLLTKELFLPNVLERDVALRTPPVPGFPWDGLADIAPFRELDGSPVIEGVY